MSAGRFIEAICLSAPTAGRMSKRARKAALDRLSAELAIPHPDLPPQPPEADRLLEQARQLRDLAARGMKPRAYAKEADRLEALARSMKR